MTGRLSARIFLATAAALFLVACSSGGGGSDDAGMGQLSLAVSDAPVQEARQVCVEFNEVELKKAGSPNQIIVFDPPAKVDLLAYQGMNASPLFVDETLEAGEYQWIRLGVNALAGNNGGAGAGTNDSECLGAGSYIVTDSGGVYGLYVPSGAESGLKLVRGFTLPVGGEADFVAEFDLMKSVHAPDGLDPDYILRPTVKLLDRTETGSIAGVVDATLATQAGCMPAVYLFDAGDAPDDNEADDEADSVDPIASAMVDLQNDGSYRYEIGPVLTGVYDLALSCDSDDPEADEMLDYVSSADNPVEVVVGDEANADF